MNASSEDQLRQIRETFGYDYVDDSFSGGLASARKVKEWFHIRPDGQPAYQERYDDVSPFSEGLAWAEKDGKWFHIRPNGQPAYEERYDFVSLFFEGLARVQKGGEEFHIRPDGTRVD